MISHHGALVHTVILAAAADSELAGSELDTIGDMMLGLPVFSDYPRENFAGSAAACMELLSEPDGLDVAIDLISGSLPPELRATAYALACDVIAVDGVATQEELRFLEMLRHALDVDRLTAAAIERGSAARYARYQAPE